MNSDLILQGEVYSSYMSNDSQTVKHLRNKKRGPVVYFF